MKNIFKVVLLSFTILFANISFAETPEKDIGAVPNELVKFYESKDEMLNDPRVEKVARRYLGFAQANPDSVGATPKELSEQIKKANSFPIDQIMPTAFVETEKTIVSITPYVVINEDSKFAMRFLMIEMEKQSKALKKLYNI